MFSLHIYLENYHYNMFLGRRHTTEQHEILDGIVFKKYIYPCEPVLARGGESFKSFLVVLERLVLMFKV